MLASILSCTIAAFTDTKHYNLIEILKDKFAKYLDEIYACLQDLLILTQYLWCSLVARQWSLLGIQRGTRLCLSRSGGRVRGEHTASCSK